MCGILFSNNPKTGKKAFISSLNEMRHRGPDAPPGYWRADANQMGHTRLKILDIDDRSNQPFWSRDGRYVIVYNGEVYNYKELAKQYDVDQSTTSDTEVVVELYAKLGPGMLNLLNGMFAIVIFDVLSNDFFVARDRLGIKPLYYLEKNGFHTLGSEISSILQLADSVEIDPIGLRQYRKARTFFRGHTLYSGVHMFPAGHYMISGRIHRYWELPDQEQRPPDDEELRDLIVSSVNYRLISDVSVGSYLSGGLDSTIVAGLADRPDTWTVGFTDNNEFKWAEIASRRFQSRHTEVLIDENEFIRMLKEMLKKRKEPISVPNEVLLYKMTRAVKTKNTVVLSGEGADELFFGYDRIFRWANENEWDMAAFDTLYSYGSHEDMEIIDYILEPFLHRGSAIDVVASFFQISHLHGLLRRLDNSTMMCSVEARVPFVDHRLVERMAGVSFDYRIKHGIVKHPLKKVFRDIVPGEIIKREKVGFPVRLDKIPFGGDKAVSPMDKWFEFNLKELGW